MPNKRVAIALSGGVDSSVAASLLQDAGYEVIGITMRLWTEETGIHQGQDSAQIRDCIDDAEQICLTLGIPFHIINLEGEFKHHVVEHFCHEYLHGRTPNPCIVCNQYVKFGFLMDYAISLGADYLATGHYVCIEHFRGAYHLLKGIDREKDQSYMLYTLRQEQLGRLLFPLGQYHKTEVRDIARQKGLHTAGKTSSQDICFVTTNYSTFMSRYFHTMIPGDIVGRQGNVVGRHRGTAFYTVGQRHGLGITGTKPIYVAKIEPDTNRLVVAEEQEIFGSKLIAGKVTWISGKAPPEKTAVNAKIRYRAPEVEATVHPQRNSAEVRFQQPQRAIAPGQSVVFYHDKEVIGGGIIDMQDQ